jgi:pilus assembly protein CpaC
MTRTLDARRRGKLCAAALATLLTALPRIAVSGQGTPEGLARPDNLAALPEPAAITAAPTGAVGLGFAGDLPTVPTRPARPADDVHRFVEDMAGMDAGITLILGQGRLLTLKEDLATSARGSGLVAVGDPTVVDYVVINRRQIRLIGLRFGSTDLSITTPDNRAYNFQVRVVADLAVLAAQLKAMFPDATLRLTQLHDHVIVEGEARDGGQVAHILETVRAYLVSIQAAEVRKVTGTSVGPNPVNGNAPHYPPRPETANVPTSDPPRGRDMGPVQSYPEQGMVNADVTVPEPRVINLIRVPGPQQVLLKVRVAELNRTALREVGADILGVDPAAGAIVGTQIGGAGVAAVGLLTGEGLHGNAIGTTGPTTTVFGILQSAHLEFLLTALRRNAVLKILAEPNLVALNGHAASFLAGGEYPVPVPQTGSGGGSQAVTVQFKEFGVRLGFLPVILDHDVVRLTVDPEVSNIDFTIGTVLVAGGSPVPGLNTRRSHTTVELRQGQTLAIAGLLSVTLDGTTSRIAGLGDLPILGPFFSNTSSSRQEKELVVLVTPYLVEPMAPEQVPPLPGNEVIDPTDHELYFHNRIEGRTGEDCRPTLGWDDPLRVRRLLELERHRVCGAHGFSD